MPRKKKLPNRRMGYTQKAVIGGQSIYLRTGEYPDGSLGEIFCSLQKEGEISRSLLNAFCIVTSIALQHGVPLEEIAGHFVHAHFEPCGVVQGDREIRMSSSILDYIFRRLLLDYGKGKQGV